MAKKYLIKVVYDELQKKAKVMCEQYCKYGEQYKKDQAMYDDKNPTFLKHCTKCPMNEFYHY